MLSVAFLLLLSAEPQAQTKPLVDNCVVCHQEVGAPIDAAIAKVKGDVHGKRGVSCGGCHGGDPGESDMYRSMDPRKGYVGRPTPRQVASFCGKCHSKPEVMKQFDPSLRVDQEAEYSSSVHGKRVAQGDTHPATCISCHGNHGVAPVKDPASPVYPTRVAETCGTCHANADLMQPYKIPTDQLQKYKESVHAEALLKKQDLSAPTCNDCHGNHGAIPPGSASVANVCGTCHARQAELLAGSPMNFSQCLACHSNHDVRHPTDAFVGVSEEAKCMSCHEKGDPGYQTAAAIHQHLTQLETAITDADAVLDRAARAGMEVSHAKFELNGARDHLVDARVLVHSFSVDSLQKATTSGMKIAEAAHTAGENALGELLYRRKGLAVSLVLIALSILGVYLKIRQIESR